MVTKFNKTAHRCHPGSMKAVPMVGKMNMQTARQPRAETALPPRVRGHLIPNAPPAQAQPRKCGDCPTWPQQPPPINGSGCRIPVIYWEGEKGEGGDLTLIQNHAFPTPLRCCSLPQNSFTKIISLGQPRPLFPCISDNHFGNWRELRCLQTLVLLSFAPWRPRANPDLLDVSPPRDCRSLPRGDPCLTIRGTNAQTLLRDNGHRTGCFDP